MKRKTAKFSVNDTKRPLMIAVFCVVSMFSVTTFSQASDPAAANPEQEAITLKEIPMPDLEALKPEVRQQLEPAIAYFEKYRPQREGAALGQLYGRLGLHFQAQQLLEAARTAYRNAVVLDSTNYRWPYLLAVNAEEMGEDNLAVTMYAVTIKLNPAYIAANIRLGLVLIRKGHLDEAEAQLLQVLKTESRNAAALTGMGLIAFEREQYQRAISFYLRALDSQPDAGQINYQLAMAYRALGDVENAELYLEKHNPRIPSIDDPLLGLMNAHRIGAEQYAKSGTELMRAGNFSEAVKMFEISTAVNPEDQPSFVALAQAYRYELEDQRAYAVIDHALELNQTDPVANYIKASWLDQDNRDQEALNYYRAALEADGDFAQARMLLGNMLLRMGKYAEAVEQYQKVIEQNDQQMTAMYLAAIAMIEENNCALAMQFIDKALQINAQNGTALIAQTRIYSTCDAATAEQKRLALANARAIYDARPVGETAATLAMALAANGEFAEATDYQAQAMFEAVKNQDAERQADLFVNMQRYQQNMPAERAWAQGKASLHAPDNLRQKLDNATAQAGTGS